MLWDITSSSPVEFRRRFGGTLTLECRLNCAALNCLAPHEIIPFIVTALET
jgi:hypothetical protein